MTRNRRSRKPKASSHASSASPTGPVTAPPTGPCYLTRLPATLLVRIFRESGVTSRRLFLCKALYPVLREVFYAQVCVFSWKGLRNVLDTLVKHPETGAFVEVFGMRACDHREPKATTVQKRYITVTTYSYEPLGPEDQPDPEVLRAVLRRLTSVKELILVGKQIVASVFGREFEPNIKKLGRVESVLLQLRDHEQYDTQQDKQIGHYLSLLPNLKDLELRDVGLSLPFSQHNFAANVRIPPASWNLTDLDISGVVNVGPEIGHLFAALTDSIRSVAVRAVRCHKAFADDLRHLPKSVTTLDLFFGTSCTHNNAGALPILDDALAAFPALIHLHLSNKIFTPAFLTRLSQTSPKLECLNFGYFAPLTGEAVLSLIEPGPSKLVALQDLAISVCLCPTDSALNRGDFTHRPRWWQQFGKSEANRVVAAAKVHGIELGGTLKCALKICRPQDGHECARM